MHFSVEAQNVEMEPVWKEQLDDRLQTLSDSRDPVISARSTFAFHENQVPPANINLVIRMRGKNIVISKKGETFDIVLKAVLETMKREIRQYYDLRSCHRLRPSERFATGETPQWTDPGEDTELMT